MNCNAAPMWRFLCAKQFGKKMFKYWWPKTTTRWALGVGRDALGVGRDTLGVGRDTLGVTRYVLKCRKKNRRGLT